MEIRQSETYLGNDWWDWSVWIDGSDAELDDVSHVEWRLHPTFPDPVRRVTDRVSKFRLDTGGWGTFVVHAVVHTKSGTPHRLRHQLQLHYPGGSSAPA